MFSRFIALCFVLTVLAIPGYAAGDDAPQWLMQAAAMKAPTYNKDVPAVVLQNEESVTVNDDGRVTTVSTYAVRILTREGREYAKAMELYLTKSGKVRELHAWLIRPNGVVKKYDKDDIVDRINDPNDIYDEYRIKMISASDDADAGVVFGYQSISEERPLFSQEVWGFQHRLPTLLSRFSLALPNGWRATSVIFNHEKLEPNVTGSTYTWELRDLPPIRPEPASPQVDNLAPWVAINYFMGDSASSPSARAFETWVQVSRWATELHDPQAVPDESIAAKTRELTANAKTEIDRIRAIARFVQSLQYISINIGVGSGNGYRPHAASQVLAKAYGDCKDKANLMRAMLKTINITAYPIAIYLGDPTHVKEEWASPNQFNHCIIAIKVSDETKAQTVIQHPTLGRLLIFDATDEHTTLGDLPDEEQGSLALIIAGDSGTLTRMPIMSPESSQLDRTADVTLSAEGAITAKVKERSTGQTAVYERRLFRGLSAPNYKHMIEEWLTRGATSALVSRVQPEDDSVDGRFGLDVDFSATSYGQLMQGHLLVFKPAIVSRREALFLTEATRSQPIVLDSHAFTETVHVKLPVGFEVDEMPDVVKLDTVFGTYKTTYEVKDGELIFTRALTLRAATIPSEQYQSVRKFFENIRAAEQSPVVLVKK
jgi:hypothetical protein